MKLFRRELFVRHPANPILSAADWPYPANTVFNPGAAVLDGQTVLLARVEALDGRSHLTVARSADGVEAWNVDAVPFLAPDDTVETERWGFEDARVVWLRELGTFAITCTAYGPSGPSVYLATTSDFHRVERHGIIRRAEDKNAALLPDRIDGAWVLLHRPMTAFGGARAEIHLSRSDDLVNWSNPEPVMKPREGAWWDSERIGIGPPPIRTEHGWLLLYHGTKATVAGSLYRVGLALLDLEQPSRVLSRTDEWVLGPSVGYERTGDVPNVVFPCGLVHERRTDEIRLYYGAADTCICLATARLETLFEALGA